MNKMDKIKNLDDVKNYWKLLEMAMLPEWLSASEKNRPRIIKKIAKVECKILKNFLNNHKEKL